MQRLVQSIGREAHRNEPTHMYIAVIDRPVDQPVAAGMGKRAERLL
jgi:hypothetical protein